jgi:hypothetical protein
MAKKFVCCECGETKSESERVFVGASWCRPCVDKESERSNREDSLSRYVKRRPPKYMLDPADYASFGY